MTTPNNEELISMLRAKGCPDWVTARWLMESAAESLQSQAERLETLDANLRVSQMSNVDKCAQIYTLRAQLAAIAATEPVNESLAEDIEALDVMYRGDPSYEHDGYYIKTQAAKLVRKGYELFTRPMPAQDVTELVDAFEHHIEQTRPIERSTIALSKYKGAK